MGSVRKYRTKWRGEARYNRKYVSKLFSSKGDASAWVKQTQRNLEREEFEDYRDSANITLAKLIVRYRDEVTPKKKGAKSEKYKLNFLLRQQIARSRILRLSPRKVIEFKNELKRTRAPATVNKYIHYIHTIWETARLSWGIVLPPGGFGN